jgi:Protein of unknown function (DUF1579)
MKSRVFMALLASCFAASAYANQQQEMPKPGPEIKKLDVFAGKWKGEGTMQPGPFGPGGTFKSEDDCTWFEGGWQLVCRGTSEGSMGKTKSEGILSWNPEEKAYKYMGFDSMGMTAAATGQVSGNTWTYTGEDKKGGKLIKSRYTIVVPDPKTQTFKWEISEDGGKTYKVLMNGKSTKM